MHSHLAYGLHIHSALPLPELVSCQREGEAEVIITPETLFSPDFPPGKNCCLRKQATNTYFAWKNVGAFLARAGREITYDAAPRVSDETVRLPLLGVVMGTLLHQRGIFTLHASAVSVDGDAVAFIGQKGAGKSTTAAALQARGHPLLTDDVLALDLADDGSVHVRPAFPQLKLQPEAATALGYEPAALSSLDDGLAKRALRPADSFTTHSVPLKRIYLLDRGTALRRERITGAAAFATLMSQTYAPRFLGSDAATPEHFRQCQRVARQVPLCWMTCPDDLSQLDAIAQFIESSHRSAKSPQA